MPKRILVWGAPATVNPKEPVLTSFERSGKNFGNLLIGNAVQSFLTENTIISRTELRSPEEANERCDHVVIPAANFLWKDFDFGYMADFLEKTILPITIIGVGAQTNDRSITSLIHPNTLRLMHLISERSASLGVRGYYTAEVLAANGIHNVKVVGCPSLYTTRCPTVKVDATRLSTLDNLSVNFSRRVYTHSFNPDRMRAIENILLKIALTRNGTFVAQDELEELSLSSGNDINTAPITDYFHDVDKNQVTRFFREQTHFFCDVGSWSSYIRAQSASVGSRFHGNLIALINGIPALTIVHDSRTMEMCALIGNPVVHVNQVDDKRLTEASLMESLLSCSFERFEQSYRVLYKRFVGFLNENGLRHNLPAAGDVE
jgi:Polysaccharide pyruvyl transferase